MRIGVLSTGRQDWGILRSTCAWLRRTEDFELRLIAGGMACADGFGRTDRVIEGEGFELAERLDWIAPGQPAHVEAGSALAMLGDALARQKVDAIVLAGDRYETLAAATAATLLRVPIIHLHGGEETEGAFDNAIRHAITKLAHLHLTSHPDHARNVVAMGEDPSTVHVVGAPGLDNLLRSDLPQREELEATLGPLVSPLVIVTVHPATLAADPLADATAVARAMDAVDATYVITMPNTDPGSAAVREVLLAAAQRPKRVAVDALGEARYWGLLAIADALLGNSSSALIEAPAVHVPAVNVGERQRGRLRGATVIDVPPDAPAVAAALRQALTPAFRRKCLAVPPLFGDGRSAEAIGRILSAWTPPSPPVKRRWEPKR
jgi:UDP-hydrolysing UDP-N-acetyl-D-glucosamine 2-epimerase